jgi:hypothetical protein
MTCLETFVSEFLTVQYCMQMKRILDIKYFRRFEPLIKPKMLKKIIPKIISPGGLEPAVNYRSRCVNSRQLKLTNCINELKQILLEDVRAQEKVVQQ